MTIEEKAELNLQYEKDFCGYNLSDNMVKRAYLKGAAEQKAIDMERICKLEEAVKAFRAFCRNILNGIYIDNEIAAVEQLRYIETMDSNDVDWNSIEEL